MKQILFLLFVCANSVYAQQKTMIKDSVLISVLNNFIDELKLHERPYKFIIVRLVRSEKELSIRSVEKTKVGEITGEKIDSEYVTNYTVTLEYHVNSRVIDADQVTYYSILRDIPILIITGVEDLLKTTKKNNREFVREIEKSSSPTALAEPIIWHLDVRDKQGSVRKPD